MPPDAPFKDWLIREILSFPNAIGQGVDDGIDALSLMGRRLVSLTQPSPKVVPIRPKTHYDMTLDELFESREKKSHYVRRI